MRPPRLALALLDRFLADPVREAVLGDLLEEFPRRALRDGPGAARRWFWRQTLASLVARGRDRMVSSGAIEDGQAERSRRHRWAPDLFHDLRSSVHVLRRTPAFSVTAVATLAVGIGAATAIATAVDRALLRPLPYPSAGRLVFVGHPNDDGTIGNVGFETVVDWRNRLTTFDRLAVMRQWSPTLVDAGGARRLAGVRVSWNYFRMLGVAPAIGRDFTESDDHEATWHVVLLTDRVWRTGFGARPDIVGASLNLYGRSYRVIGVLPARFEPLISEHFYQRAEVFAPLGYEVGGDSSCRSCQHLRAIGRLAPNASTEAARAELAAVHAELRREHPSDYTATPPGMVGLHDEIDGALRRPLQMLAAAVGFVLLVACANVAGLLVARSAGRETELALRAALGAGRGRLTRQLLTESAVLAAVAALAGIGLARLGLAALVTYTPVRIPRLQAAVMDPSMLAAGIAIATAALVLFGVVPAWTAARGNLQSVLRSTRQSAGRRAIRAREVLMVAEVAAALTLVMTAGLMRQSVVRLLSVDPGFDARQVAVASLSLVGPRWAEDAAVRSFQHQLLERARSIPGVEHVALAGQVPLGSNWDRWGFRVEGQTGGDEADLPEAERYSVTPDYFATMRILLRRGRLFDEHDTTDSPLVVIVNDTAARTLFGGSDPIGHRVRVGGIDAPWRTVVGIVADVRHYALDVPPNPQFYSPQGQMTDSFLVLVARSSVPPETLAAPIRHVVASLATDVPIYDATTLEALVNTSAATRRFLMNLLALFSLATLAMAAVGLYGVVTQSVSARRKEFGIRLALGARPGDIVRLVLTRGLALVGVGIACGAATAVGAGRLIRSELYDTAPGDPAVVAVAVGLLGLAAILAHLAPLRRATSVDPSLPLRGE